MIKYADLAKKVNQDIKDSQLKELLFGMSSVEEDDIKGIGAIYTMLSFAFVFTFAKWKTDLVSNRIATSSPNAKRVFDAFECIYNGEDVTLDLMIYVLTEMQLDQLSHGDKSYFSFVIDNNSESLQVPSLRNLIKTWLQSAKHAEKNLEVLAKNFYGLYRCFPFLQKIELKKNANNDLCFINTFDDSIVETFALLIENEDGYFYLASFENTADNLSRLTYNSIDGVKACIEIMPTRAFYIKSMLKNPHSLPKSIFAKSLFSIGFKYIKNLSLAISDAITNSTKQKLNEHYSNKYNDVFELGYKKYSELNWDNIITILMIEEGPTELLEFVLDSDGFYFDKILQNLELRYNDIGLVTRVKSEFECAQQKEMELIRSYIDDNSLVIKNIISINKTFMAKSIVDALAQLENNKKRSNALFVESLAMRIKGIDKIISSSETMESKVIKINKALEKTFRYIIPFYSGIIEYQKTKEDTISELDKKGVSEDFLDKKVLFDRCEERFFAKVKSVVDQIKTKSLGSLIADFRELVKSVAVVKGNKIMVTNDGRALQEAIGRDKLCSLDTFEKILEFKSDDLIGIESDNIPKNIVSFINNDKHWRQGYSNANIVLFNKFLLYVKELFYFLVYNEDYQREMILGQQISFDPIYPYIVRYTVRSENRDGYNINNFSVFISDEGANEIKILSEREYEINEKYYCIPNLTTSNSRWWIEPFLVSCRKFDMIIHGDKEE